LDSFRLGICFLRNLRSWRSRLCITWRCRRSRWNSFGRLTGRNDVQNYSVLDIDELGRATGLAARAIQVALLELTLAGRVERHGHQLVSRKE